MSFSGWGCCSVCVGEEHHFHPITAEGTYYQLSLHTVSVGLGHMTKVVFVRFSIVKLTFPPTFLTVLCWKKFNTLTKFGLMLFILQAEYLHKLFAIFLYGSFYLFSPFCLLSNHLFISLWTHESNPYDYTVEVTNIFKGLDLIECVKNYGWRFMTLYRRQWSRPSPRKNM